VMKLLSNKVQVIRRNELQPLTIDHKPLSMVNGPLSFVIVGFLLLFSFVSAADPFSDFKRGNEYYQKQDYDNAIKAFEQLIKEGDVSAEVYYNLGNAYYKTGNVPHTLLNYERAHKLSPDDEDINFNLKIASLKVVDKMDAVPEIFYKRWLKAIALEFTTETWTAFFLASIWMLFIFLAVYVVASSASLKKSGFVFAVIFLAISAVVFVLAQKSYSMMHVDQQAIIMPSSVYVKSSPDEKGSDQFILHEGTKVDVLDEFAEWKKIRIANGSIGWLKQKEIEII
jgi:tetratricopeptide (TPR) repeat protein